MPSLKWSENSKNLSLLSWETAIFDSVTNNHCHSTQRMKLRIQNVLRSRRRSAFNVSLAKFAKCQTRHHQTSLSARFTWYTIYGFGWKANWVTKVHAGGSHPFKPCFWFMTLLHFIFFAVTWWLDLAFLGSREQSWRMIFCGFLLRISSLNWNL